MLFPCKRVASDWLATILDHAYLDNNGSNDDNNEENIVEKAMENVVLKLSKFS
jgi:hypothetical protein